MDLYAESSAVLVWLLREPYGAEVATALIGARQIFASDLTLIECRRVLSRGVAGGRLSEAVAADRQARLASVATRWNVLRLDGEIVERAGQPFPEEPIRTLDALHLASALVARTAAPGLAVLSLDGRVRRSAEELGFDLMPVAGEG